MSDIEWFAVYKQTIEADAGQPTMSRAEIDALVAEIVAGRIEIPAMQRSRRSRRRWIAAGAAISVIAGGATAAALLNRSKPSHPEEGIACHIAADVASGAQVVPPAVDPLAACAQLWLTGALPDIDHPGRASEVAPPMFACVDPGGGLDVFPILSEPAETCAGLGLVEAITDVSSDPMVVLQDRLVTDINDSCVDLDTARRLAQVALNDLSLKDWTITVRENTKDCVKAGEDPETKSVFLQSVPN